MYPATLCTTPFGLPVEPEVYNINKGSSASIATGATNGKACVSTFLISSSHQTSRPFNIDTAVLVLVQTITRLIVLFPIKASSMTDFNGMSLAPLYAPSQVIIYSAFASSNLSAILCALNPPKITL